MRRWAVLRLTLVALLVTVVSVSPATAAIIDFAGPGGGGGTVAFAGGVVSPLVGTGIAISSLGGVGTPANTITGIPVTGGVLNFTTGAFMGTDALGFLQFAPGGSLTLTGGVAAAGIAAGSTLISALNVAAAFHPNIGVFPGSSMSLTIPGGADTKNPNLLTFFGFALGTPFQFTGTVSGPSVIVGPSGFSEVVVSTDIMNTAVPEPSTMLLLGTGVVGLVVGIRRKLHSRPEA